MTTATPLTITIVPDGEMLFATIMEADHIAVQGKSVPEVLRKLGDLWHVHEVDAKGGIVWGPDVGREIIE